MAKDEDKAPSANTKENDLLVATIKEKDVEQQILASEQFKECKEGIAQESDVKKREASLETCLKDKFKSLSDEELEELSGKLELGAYDPNANKSTKSIKSYLTDRVTKALRGDTKKDAKEITLKDMKYVDHSLYSKIYRSQIGKNILLETANYCLENLGLKDEATALVNYCAIPGVGDQETGLGKNCKIKGEVRVKDITESVLRSSHLKVGRMNGNKFKKFGTDNNWDKQSLISVMKKSDNSSSFWKDDAFEYRVCDPMKKADGSFDSNCKTDTTRTSSAISEMKRLEFDLGVNYMKGKIAFCTQVAIKNMCEVYKCRNVYDSSKLDEHSKKKCKELGFSQIEIGRKVEGKKEIGLKACGVLDRLKEYRRVIAALDKIDSVNDKSKGTGKGFRVKDVFAGKYTGGKGEKSIEEITTIASSELSGLSINDESEIEKLKGECFSNGEFNKDANKECEKLIANELDYKKAQDISAEMEAEKAAYLARVDKLASEGEGGKEGLKKYLEKQGLGHLADEESLSADKLATIIKDDYKAQRAALKKSMEEKFARTKDLKDAEGNVKEAQEDNFQKEIGNIAKENIVNMEKEKERIQTLIQYSNVLSSYLGAQISGGDEEDNTETTLAYQRQIELEHAKNDKSEANQQFATDEEYFNGEEVSQSTENANLQVDLAFIDSLLGNTEKSENILKLKEENK